MADLAPFQILRPRRRSRSAALPSEATFSGHAPCPGLVALASGGFARWAERQGVEIGALFGWVGNGR